MTTKIVASYPPNYPAIVAALGEKDPSTIFAYDRTIYWPKGGVLPSWLVAHEETHFAQHERFGGCATWWSRYLEDAEFRYTEELEAHRAEFKAYRRVVADRNAWARMRVLLIRRLCSPLYGGVRKQHQVAREL